MVNDRMAFSIVAVRGFVKEIFSLHVLVRPENRKVFQTCDISIYNIFFRRL
jgi:L-rhamnose mutarotase